MVVSVAVAGFSGHQEFIREGVGLEVSAARSTPERISKARRLRTWFWCHHGCSVMGWLLNRLLHDKRYLLHVGYCACVGRGTVPIKNDLNGRGRARKKRASER